MVWNRVSGDETGDVVAFSRPATSAWSNPALAPKDGRHILGYGRIRWSSFDFKLGDKPVRAVVYWFNDEVDGDDPVLSRSGWRLINANPYADYMDLEAWQELPAPPDANDQACFEPGITTFPVEGGYEVSVHGRRREGVWPTWLEAVSAAAKIEREERG